MTVATLDAAARLAVMRQLEDAFERLAVKEQIVRTTDPASAEEFHAFGNAVLRARLAEEDDPEPQPACRCAACGAAYAKGLR